MDMGLSSLRLFGWRGRCLNSILKLRLMIVNKRELMKEMRGVRLFGRLADEKHIIMHTP
jgi:hypothetical protein